jgi:hypothetical protein
MLAAGTFTGRGKLSPGEFAVEYELVGCPCDTYSMIEPHL